MRPHVTRKRFGQHFLIDRQIIDEIVEQIAPDRADRMVEIGPGLAALTDPLLRRVDHLHAIEIDRDLVARLRQRHPPERLTVHAGDTLAFDFAPLARGEPASLRVVGNLPYNISTPLLFHLAGFSRWLRDVHVMLQQEVGERLLASPGSGQFGRLSVMAQYCFAIHCLLRVPRGAFRPPPAVESVVVRLTPRAPSELAAKDETVLAALVATAFGQRRKMLRNSLGDRISENTLHALGISPSCRAEDLSVADYVLLANHLAGARQ